MSDGRATIQFVMDSGVRSEVLREACREPMETDALLSSVDASESAVYEALTDLQRRRVVVSDGGSWVSTAKGQVICELLQQRDRAERLFEGTDYWEHHDASVLPERFRRSLPVLADARILQADDRNPHRLTDRISKRIEGTEAVSIVTPIYHREYASSMPDTDESRLLVDRAVADSRPDDVGRPNESLSNAAVRISEVDFALGVSEDWLLLSLPTLEGKYDARSEIVANDSKAIEWGEQLFEHVWERSRPPESRERTSTST